MSKPQQKMSGNERRAYILENGAKLADVIGLDNVTAKLVAGCCPIRTSIYTVRFYFNNTGILRDAIKKSPYYKKQASR